MGAVSPFGRGVETLLDSVLQGASGVRVVPELAEVGGLRSRVGALVPEIDPREIPRKHRRSMSRMSIFATLASRDAMEQGGVSPELCSGGRLGVSLGSTVGSSRTIGDFFEDYLTDHSLERMRSTFFFQIMNHSCAANVAQTFGITGRLLAPSSACSTGCQAVGYGFEMIAAGRQELMLSGGADEFHPLTVATFDVMNAASTGYNEHPGDTPRPFDLDRDGVVCGEGAGVLLLESLESARARKADILAEVTGFGTVVDPSSIANPSAGSMEQCMRLALAEAGIEPEEVDYVNSHATATVQGDIAESEAIARVFGSGAAVSSLKGHLGHAMAASGALELGATIAMMNRNRLAPTRNLRNVDPACSMINHVRAPRDASLRVAIKNNFALGGVNSSIVLRRFEHD